MKFQIRDLKFEMAAIVQRLERLIVVQDVVGSNPTSRPISFLCLQYLRLTPKQAFLPVHVNLERINFDRAGAIKKVRHEDYYLYR